MSDFILYLITFVLASSGFLQPGIRQFRGNNLHTFYGTGEIPETEPNIVWNFRTGQNFSKTLQTPWEGLGWTGQPAVTVEDSGMFVYIAALDGHVYKLDFNSGKLIKKTAENYDIIKSSPAVTDKYVIFGSWSNCVHIIDKNTFEWVHSETAIFTPSASYDFDGSPAVEDTFLYIGGEDGYLRKIILNPPFERVWVYPSTTPQSDFRYGENKKPYVGIESSVAIRGDTLVVGTGSGKVWMVDKNSGSLIAEFATHDDTDSSPVIDTTDSSFFIGVEKDFTKNQGGLYKISLSGKKRWFFATKRQGVYSTPAIDSHRVVFTGDDGYLYSLDKKTGELQWKTRLADGSWSSPVLLKDRILTADFSGYLYGIDANDGKILWQKKIGNYIVSSPVVWEGTIIVGTRDGFIYALK